ncbi:MAG: hypothetical protein JWM59_3327 [Verrucomicrobiales bacterium]|nr:hypothetical protein [Verrucomicrobiales bacterium]
MRLPVYYLLLLAALFPVWTSPAMVPEHTIQNGVVSLVGVGPDNPILYDNDFWTDVPDAAYLWMKVSLGEAKLVGNIITRCTFGWEEKYAHELRQQTDEAAKLLRLARESGLKNIPEPVVGSTVAIRRPPGDKESDTAFERTEGSALIIAEAKKATPEKPLLVFVGGSCTTIASAFLAEPSITERIVVFQVDGGGYNGSDQWAWDITRRHFKFVNWARGYFWGNVSVWPEARFKELPENPLGGFLRGYAASDLGKANQWGDGAWLFQLFAPGCITAVEDDDQQGITVPRHGNNTRAMEDEFFRTMKTPHTQEIILPSTIKPVVSTVTGLLLEPPVDLSKFTREEFLRVSASVGPHKINKPWTTAIPALPPHPRSDVHGLDEREIRACMLQARDLFEKGAAVPVSDVGLISTQEDVIRRPMFNHVSAFSNEVAHVYLLVQKPAGADAWGTFSIVQDRTTNPPLNYFAEIKGSEVRFEAVSCYKCHANGPLAVHPARGDLINDAALLKAFNQHIGDQPLSRMHYPPHDPAPAYGDPLTLKACTKCHANDADRAPLFKVHSHSIRVLVDYGHMPPARPLRPEELAEIKAWLAVKP